MLIKENNKIKYKHTSDFEISDRIKKLMERRAKYIKERRQIVWSDVKGMRYGHATGLGLGEGITKGERMVAVGDQDNAVRLLPEGADRISSDYDDNLNVDWIDPSYKGYIPSMRKKDKNNPMSFAEDYEALLDYSPAEIYSYEEVVGEYHWGLTSIRGIKWPDQIRLSWLRNEANDHGADGVTVSHTCTDLEIGFKLGWGDILKKVRSNLEKFEKEGEKNKADYLRALEKVCKSIIKYIDKYSTRARTLAKDEKDPQQKSRYLRVAQICKDIATEPPKTFHGGIQWIAFYFILERIWVGANGYGHLDWILNSLYKKDLKEQRITHKEAVELVANFLVKFSIFFSLGGRNKNLKDATNEVSWIFLEAYNMVGGQNNFGVMWHSDIDRDFFRYACSVALNKGTGTPALVNYDVMRKSFIYYGTDKKDAQTVAYSGCYWYCMPGVQYNGDDMAAVNVLICFKNAIDIAFKEGIESYDQLWELFCYELREAAVTLKRLLDPQYEMEPMVLPEMVASLMTHSCIEIGKDITDCGVKYNMTTVQMEGLANVADSFAAIKKIIFEEKKLKFSNLKKLLNSNYEGYEDIRQILLNAPKYGNDDDFVDSIARDIVDQYKLSFSDLRNCKGGVYRLSVYSWTGSPYAHELISATPDGRREEDLIAQGPNPMRGRCKKGITAAMKSVSKLGFEELAGGSFQLEMDPNFLRLEDNKDKVLSDLVWSYFTLGGVHVFVNVVSVETLEKAMKNSEMYEDLVVRVTGYSAHFTQLDEAIQKDIISRTRFGNS